MVDAAVYAQVIKRALAPLTDSFTQRAQKLLDLGSTNRSRASALARLVWDDTRGTLFVENWVDMTHWSTTATLQVSAGKLFGLGGGGAAGINHALTIPSNGAVRIVTTLTVTSTANAGSAVIGISSDAAGGAFTSGAAKVKGLVFGASASSIEQWDNGATTALTNTTAITVGTYTVTILIDANFYSIVAVSQDGSNEWRARWARSAVTPNNVSIFLGDSGNLAGRYVGPVAVMADITTASPRQAANSGLSNEGGYSRTVLWTSNPNTPATGNIRIGLPKNYDARVPSPWVMLWHGHGSNETTWADNFDGQIVANAFNKAGFITIGFASSTETPWGAQLELDASYGTYLYAREHLNLGPGLFYCNSMGSIDGLLALAEDRIPGVLAYVGTSPTFSLLANYDNATQPFTASINTSYSVAAGTLSAAASVGDGTLSSSVTFAAGTKLLVDYANATPGSYEEVAVESVSGSGPYVLTLVEPLAKAHASTSTISDYPTKTAGHDPALMDARQFRGVPILVLAASDDTTVLPPLNAVPLLAALTPYAPEALSDLNNTGGHSFPFQPYTLGTSPFDIINFAKRHTAA